MVSTTWLSAQALSAILQGGNDEAVAVQKTTQSTLRFIKGGTSQDAHEFALMHAFIHGMCQAADKAHADPDCFSVVRVSSPYGSFVVVR